jgi:hypothetical protein
MYVFLIVIAEIDEKGYSTLGTSRCILHSTHLLFRLDNWFFNASKSPHLTKLTKKPTFNPDLAHSPFHHDVVLLQRWSISLHQFKRGDVVTLYSPQNPDLLTTKRIIALEGDLVTPLPPSGPTPVRIPAGHCWVEGDSRFNTKDSNTYGPVCSLCTKNGLD